MGSSELGVGRAGSLPASPLAVAPRGKLKLDLEDFGPELEAMPLSTSAVLASAAVSKPTASTLVSTLPVSGSMCRMVSVSQTLASTWPPTHSSSLRRGNVTPSSWTSTLPRTSKVVESPKVSRSLPSVMMERRPSWQRPQPSVSYMKVPSSAKDYSLSGCPPNRGKLKRRRPGRGAGRSKQRS